MAEPLLLDRSFGLADAIRRGPASRNSRPISTAATAAQRYYDLCQRTLRVDTHLNVFTVQTSLLSNQQTVLSLHLQQMTSSVELIEALGGGWNANLLPSTKEAAARNPKFDGGGTRRIADESRKRAVSFARARR
jgi:hypothetical protein